MNNEQDIVAPKISRIVYFKKLCASLLFSKGYYNLKRKVFFSKPKRWSTFNFGKKLIMMPYKGHMIHTSNFNFSYTYFLEKLYDDIVYLELYNRFFFKNQSVEFESLNQNYRVVSGLLKNYVKIAKKKKIGKLLGQQGESNKLLALKFFFQDNLEFTEISSGIRYKFNSNKINDGRYLNFWIKLNNNSTYLNNFFDFFQVWRFGYSNMPSLFDKLFIINKSLILYNYTWFSSFCFEKFLLVTSKLSDINIRFSKRGLLKPLRYQIIINIIRGFIFFSVMAMRGRRLLINCSVNLIRFKSKSKKKRKNKIQVSRRICRYLFYFLSFISTRLKKYKTVTKRGFTYSLLFKKPILNKQNRSFFYQILKYRQIFGFDDDIKGTGSLRSKRNDESLLKKKGKRWLNEKFNQIQIDLESERDSGLDLYKKVIIKYVSVFDEKMDRLLKKENQNRVFQQSLWNVKL
jgi:hypothetical protein